MNINDLELFVTVAKLGSFSKAAQSLDTRRALVSRKIAELERQLGAPLFTRTTRAMSLTPSGELYLEQVEPLLKQLQNAAFVFKNRYNEVQGRLRIGLLPFVDKIMDKQIADFIHSYPQVQLDIFVIAGGYKELTRLGLDFVMDAGEINDGHFTSKKLTTIERKIYASPSYLEKSSVIETMDDLQYHSLLGFRAANGLVENTWQFQHASISVNHKVTCSDFNSLYNFCLGGAGITLLPQTIANDAVASQQLINVLPELSAGFTDINLIYPNNSSLSTAANVFMEYILREAKESI
ncbi:LysR family transcriptional regulator [Shewanella aestuarii]|uniref:LysR family transcriptional regulator n=1 Tax=Shewanella aestuarii TaxID=1028752 RepID=A0A6G9QG41_9GAMM|nr:LysR family transcriptional regulator [Shewanella aestuarii]QIR13490.1 LysR family transcriptional regulator [Shewanella aestuarii]